MIAFCLLTCGLLAGPLALTAHAEGNASAFIAEGNLSKDGTLKVKQTITLAGAVPPELSQKFETREDLVGDRQYVQKLSDITATVKGAQVQPTIKTDDRFTTVTVPTNGATEVVMSYTVTGAVVKTDSGTALRWGMLQGLSASVAEFTATVQIPTQFSYIKCTAGSPNSTDPLQFCCCCWHRGLPDPNLPRRTARRGRSGDDRHRVPSGWHRLERGDRVQMDARSCLSPRSRCLSRSRWACWPSALSHCTASIGVPASTSAQTARSARWANLCRPVRGNRSSEWSTISGPGTSARLPTSASIRSTSLPRWSIWPYADIW
jgi:hypothetical protein